MLVHDDIQNYFFNLVVHGTGELHWKYHEVIKVAIESS